MDEPNLYAFYGSLRRGMRLFNQFSSSLKYQYSMWLTGFELYSLGNYPYAIKSNNPKSKILVEVFQISDPDAEKEIQDIEKGAGYYLEQLRVRDEVLHIFLYESEDTNNLRVDSGDWVSFFRQ